MFNKLARCFRRNKKQKKEKQEINKFEELLGSEDAKVLRDLINAEKKIPPKIAIIGKSGVGKTTTINSLFSAKWNTSHSIAGTKKAQMKEFYIEGDGKLSIYDMPGLGEDIDEDEVYKKIYEDILPKVDVVLWVIQANARDISDDQRILREIVLPSIGTAKNKLIIGLNQVDKIGPGEWDLKFNYPSVEQENSISRRCDDIVNKLSSIKVQKDKIIYYSAEKRFRLYELLAAMISASGELGWKLPIQPKDSMSLADKDIQQYLASNFSKQK